MLSLCIFGSMVVYPTPAMATVAQSPTIKVRGQVVDEQGEPLTGATIKIKGGQGGTITDLDGNFQLEVLGNATLLISYVGYKEREVAVRNRAIIDPIQLQSDEQMLEQVVVVGYGTQKKSDLTGSVAVVDAEALKQTSNSNISTMLEGKVSGVQITSDGQPGADPTVRIRGVGSFGSTAPLYVIDGVPMGTSIRDFSSKDIETIQVLKDASAAAIYGSRAANGVVLITTKQGSRTMGPEISFSTFVGISKVTKSFDVLNARQYRDLMEENGAVSGLPADLTDRTDWFDETYSTGVNQNYQFSISNGDENSSYYLGGGYTNETGIISTTSSDRYNVKASLDKKIFQWFSANASTTF